MPLVSEPWFELPIVTEWTRDKANEKYTATNIERHRVNIIDMPAVINSDLDVIASMNQYDLYVAEQKQHAQEEAEAKAKAR